MTVNTTLVWTLRDNVSATAKKVNNSLDQVGVRAKGATGLIGKLRSERGFTVVVIEHDMKVVRDVSDRVVVLDHGVKIAEGTYEEVSTDDSVIEAYLGRPAAKEGS